MKPFYVSCEAPALSNLAEIWHSTADEGALQLQPAMHLNVWGMSPHAGDLSSVIDRSEKSLREPSPSHSRQKWISWDILCQLQFALNPCEWAFPKGAIKVLLNFSVDGLSSTEIRWSDWWGCYMGGVLSQTTWLLGWFKVLFCVATVCDKLRAEPHNISMIPTLI